ncbi:hypothetical protein M434DRAFT_9776 [Hypoxylon sp. CO27-5]|nr:hypothetical protein M434DRAFT_9776 [Hypoxylon sp. CO27-5]
MRADRMTLEPECRTEIGKCHSMKADDASNRIYAKYETRTVLFHIKTVFLFTRSDLKTVLLPQSVFAMTISLSKAGQILVPNWDPAEIIKRAPWMLIWLWLHLLISDVGNQRLPDGILEDTKNKPWRPLPAGRLSPDEAQRLLRIIVPVAVGSSFFFGSFITSVTFMTLLWLYNDLDASSSSPFYRNVLNAAGIACFGWGSVACLTPSDMSIEGCRLLKLWVSLVSGMVASTIYAQDFPDLEGDLARGRRTIPLVYGVVGSRLALSITVVGWSITCPAFWHIPLPAFCFVLTTGYNGLPR